MSRAVGSELPPAPSSKPSRSRGTRVSAGASVPWGGTVGGISPVVQHPLGRLLPVPAMLRRCLLPLRTEPGVPSRIVPRWWLSPYLWASPKRVKVLACARDKVFSLHPQVTMKTEW